MTDPLEDLAAKQARLDQARAAADHAQLDRDRAIVTARDSGATWAAIQEKARMSSPRAVAKAIARAEEAEIHDQLTSEYGERFTKKQADYAIANLPD